MSVQFVASCAILGGTNGSGKSTIYEEAVRPQIEGEFVNADIIARRISPEAPEAASLRAGKQVVVRLDDLITKRQNFVHETTLSSISIARSCNRGRSSPHPALCWRRRLGRPRNSQAHTSRNCPRFAMRHIVGADRRRRDRLRRLHSAAVRYRLAEVAGAPLNPLRCASIRCSIRQNSNCNWRYDDCSR
jgi:hypothetical protein